MVVLLGLLEDTVSCRLNCPTFCTNRDGGFQLSNISLVVRDQTLSLTKYLSVTKFIFLRCTTV